MKIRQDRNFAAKVSQASKAPGGAFQFSTSKALKYNRIAARIVREQREKLAADRGTFGSELIAFYESIAAALKELADFILAGNGAIDPQTFREIFWPFSIWHLAIFEPLADNLTYDEEDRLRLAANALRESWRLFFGVVRMRLSQGNDAVLAGETAALACTDFVENFFLGEIEPELSDEYNRDSDILNSVLTELGELLK